MSSAAKPVPPPPDDSTERPARNQLRTVLASTVIGTTVEWYDFFLYGVAAGIIFNKQFFPSHDPTVATLLSFTTFALGFVARPVGGLIFGHIGDRVGRKRTLVMTMLIMGVATFLIGCLPTYGQIGVLAPILLVVLRLLQGIAVGGEWGGAILMSVEYAPRDKRSLFGSVPQMGLAFGLVLGTGVFALASAVMDDAAFNAWGWRVTFWLSLVLVIVGLVVRLKVMETPAFRTLQETEDTAVVPAKILLADRVNRRNLFLGMGARWVEGVAFNTWAVFSITYATGTLKMQRESALLGVMVAAIVLLAFIPIGGLIADRITARRTFAIGAAVAALAPLLAFPLMNTGNPWLNGLALVIVLGILYGVLYGPEGAFFAELFPVKVRYSGISVVYQMSGIVASGLTPLILTWLLDKAGGGVGLIVGYFLVTGLISTVCALLLRPVPDGVPLAAPASPATAG
ncbi:MHS family MFS transporter [Calidifontibacter sp. DB0510]|uniref:Putative proline/betaine transporter n=1 Tax=Metallococcus carri TaxID=1656884 RepID=A0A967B375_9MICO|nr:MFS transporter [Metallococcus carri]NHN56698.1 MHS family MFS transporter [Metallococcus carri]NOP37925.1 MHS family MFS transporter [Calidifontibacter sp. DB2511S]